MTDQIQKLAEELAKICHQDIENLDIINGDCFKEDWINIAKHVLGRELEARIDQVDEIYKACEKSGPVPRTNKTSTIIVVQTVEDYVNIKEKLTNQLQQLRGGK